MEFSRKERCLLPRGAISYFEGNANNFQKERNLIGKRFDDLTLLAVELNRLPVI